MVFSQHASFSCSFKQYLIVIVQQYKKKNSQKLNIKILCNGTSNLIGSNSLPSFRHCKEVLN